MPSSTEVGGGVAGGQGGGFLAKGEGGMGKGHAQQASSTGSCSLCHAWKSDMGLLESASIMQVRT